MGRNILLITTDQMRFDALGCNGGEVARTPVIDSLAASGINYTRAHNQNVVHHPGFDELICDGETVHKTRALISNIQCRHTRNIQHFL